MGSLCRIGLRVIASLVNCLGTSGMSFAERIGGSVIVIGAGAGWLRCRASRAALL